MDLDQTKASVVFENQEDPLLREYILAEIEQAERIRILVHRGGRLVAHLDPWRALWRDTKLTPIQYLCPDPNGYWPTYREKELQSFLGEDEKEDDVDIGGVAQETLIKLKQKTNRGNVEIRMNDTPCLAAMLFLTDKKVFFHPLSNSKRGEEMPILLFEKGSIFFDFFDRAFSMFWEMAAKEWDGSFRTKIAPPE